jgi:hypothetical protein
MVLVLLAGCGGDDPPAGIAVRDLTVESTAVGRDMAVKVVVPEGGGAKRPLLVFLQAAPTTRAATCTRRCSPR